MARECSISVCFQEEGPSLYEQIKTLLEQLAQGDSHPWRRG